MSHRAEAKAKWLLTNCHAQFWSAVKCTVKVHRRITASSILTCNYEKSKTSLETSLFGVCNTIRKSALIKAAMEVTLPYLFSEVG